MTDGNRRKQAQAVFFSVVMVLSMVGGSVAFAGSAAADTTELTLSDNLVQGGDTVFVNGSVNANGTVQAYIDENGDGQYNSANDTITGSADVANFEEDSSFSIEFDTSSLESGTYEVFVNQSDTLDEDSTGERSAELQVDADEPTFGNETPEDGSNVTQANGDLQITVPIEDANTSVETITATVKNNDGDINTYEINPNTATGDGVGWDGSDLVIEPGVGNVPSIADDTYNVDVSATDKVGNSNSTSFGFTVDSDKPTSEFNLPDLTNDVPRLTNDENETITVSLNASESRSINDSTVSLDIEGPRYSESFDYEDDEYTNSTEAGGPTFIVNPGESEVPSLKDNKYDVTVSAEDDIGNAHEETYNFELDQSQITAEGVTLSEDDLNTMSDDPTVTVEFGEDVDASEVSAEVNIDGELKQTLNFAQSGDREAEATLDLESYNNLENDSAVINVTRAQDLAGNGLINPNDSDSRTHFEIDTDGPSVTLGELPNGGTLSGYVNVTSFVANTEDVAVTEYSIEAGDDDDSEVPITDTAENLDTRTLLDGDHRLVVVVTDDNGNTATTDTEFTLDNGQSLTVAQKYLEGGFEAFDHEVDEESIQVSDLFSTGPFEAHYTLNGDDVGGDHDIDAEDYRGHVVSVTASDDGEEQTVTLDFGPLVGVESVEGDTVDIGIESSEELDELNVTLETTDDFYEQTERSYTIEHFEEHETADGYIYSLTAEDLRDGEYEVTVDQAVTVDGVTKATDLDDNNDDATVDAEDPSAETAYVIGSDGGGTLVRVEFSEDITLEDASTTTFRGASDALARVDDNGDGTLNVFLNGEVQTADAPLLNVSDVTETTDDGSTSDTSTEVATISLDLTADGLNVISLPAEAGSVNIEETELNTPAVDGVFAYDAAGNDFDESFAPDAQENSLTELEGGEAYVVTVEQDITVEFNVQNVPSEELQAPQSQQITEGYNLIGHYQESRQSVGQALTYLETDYDVERGYSGVQVDTLEPGEGYWLFSNGAGVHAPVNYGGISSDRPTVGNVQLSETNDDSVLRQSEQVEISATVQHDDVIDSVAAFLGDLAADTDSVTLTDDNNDGEYTGTLTVNFSEDAEGSDTLTIPVQAVDVDGNAGFDRSGEVQTASDAGRDDPSEPKSVTNNDTGVEYNSLTAALNEAEEFQTLELSAGTFARDRDSLTISTNNLKLVGQGENETSIRPEVRITGDSVEIEQIRFEEINPSGDVTVLGDGVTLDSVNADNTISIEGDGASVDDSNASTVDITGSNADVDNVNANDTISIEGDDASVDNSNASTVDITGSGASVSNSQATTVTVNGSNANITDSSADTVSVESGGSDASLDIDSNETTVDESVSDTVSVSNVTIRVSTTENLTTAANGGTVKGINVSEADGDVTVRVAEGTYETSVTVDVEGLTLEGPNAGTPGYETRGDEAIVGSGLVVDANDVTVDGVQVENDDTNGIRFNRAVDNVTVENTRVTNVTGDRASNGIQIQLTEETNGTMDNLVIRNNEITNVSTMDQNSGGTLAIGVNVLPRGNDVDLEVIDNRIASIEPGAAGDGKVAQARAVSVDTQLDGDGMTGRADGVEIRDNVIEEFSSDRLYAISVFEDARQDDRPGVKNFQITNNTIRNMETEGDRAALFVGGYENLGAEHQFSRNTIESGAVFRLVADGQVDSADALNASNNTFTNKDADAYYSDVTEAADLDTVLESNNFSQVNAFVDDKFILPDAGQDEVRNLNTGERFAGANAIQNAVNNASPDNKLRVGPGTFDESVTVDVEGLTLEGPNAGLAGDSSERGDEALINRTRTPDSGGSAVSITTAGVTVDGFQIESAAQNGISVDQPVSNVTLQNNRITSVAGNTFGSGDGDRETANGIAFGLSGSATQTTVTGLEVSDNVITGVTTDDLADSEDRTSANGVQVLTRQHNVEGMEITGNVISDLEPGDSGESGKNRSRGIVVNVGNNDSTVGAADGFTITDNDISGLTGASGFSDAAGIALFEAGGAADGDTDRIGPKNFTVANNQLDNLTNTGDDPAPAIYVGGIQTLGDSHSVTGNTINDGSVIRLAENQTGFDPATADALNASDNTFTDKDANAYYVDGTKKADLYMVFNSNDFTQVNATVEGKFIVPETSS